MKPLFVTIIEPEGGKKYSNVEVIGGIEFVMNTTISDVGQHFTNRIGIVKHPRKGSPLKEGDKVIVHHNVFAQYWGFTGSLMESSSNIDDKHFFADDSLIYAYNRGDGWVALGEYCFVKPTGELVGEVKYINPEKGIVPGTPVHFTPYSEHKYHIDGEELYRMRFMDIVCSYEKDKEKVS